MNRIERLNALRLFFESRRIVTAQEIAEHFGLSMRTIYRDIKNLQETGIAIEGEAGVGYRLSRHARLAPVAFDNAEAVGLLLAIQNTEPHLDQHHAALVEKACDKIRSAMPNSGKDILETSHKPDALSDYGFIRRGPLDPEILYPIQRALLEGRQLEVRYNSSNGQITADRRVIPIGILYYGGCWHMIAYCPLRDDYRDFSVNQLLSLVDRGPHDRQNLLTLEKYLHLSIPERRKSEIGNLAPLTECHISFAPEFHWLFERTRSRFGYLKQSPDNNPDRVGWISATFFYDNIEELARWLLAFLPGCHIEGPTPLQEAFEALKQEILILAA